MNLVLLPETLPSLEELLAVKLLEFGPNISLIKQINSILAFINMILYARVDFLCLLEIWKDVIFFNKTTFNVIKQ